jgi:hypothetical protein
MLHIPILLQHPLTFFLSDALRCAEERANTLEAKLKTSETARKKAEKDVADVEGLCQRLKTAEDALSDKESRQVERENAVERFETQNRRCSSKPFFHFPSAFACFFLYIVFTNSCVSPVGKMGEQYTLNQ